MLQPAPACSAGRPPPALQGQNFHILAYVIPGLNGETEPGQRRINFVWYWNTDEETLQVRQAVGQGGLSWRHAAGVLVLALYRPLGW